MAVIRTLLIVEDDAILARSAARHFNRLGFEVSVAPTSATALASTGPYDIGVFDLLLPDGDGIDVADKLMQDGVVRAAIFFSGTTDERLFVGHRPEFVPKAEGLKALAEVVQREVERLDRVLGRARDED